MLGFFSFMYLPAPVMVPPVPTPHTKTSTCRRARALSACWPQTRKLQILICVPSGREVSRSLGKILSCLEDHVLSRMPIQEVTAVHFHLTGQPDFLPFPQ